MTIEIQVTQEDIDTAVRNNSNHCVVANAIQRTYPDADKVLVDIQTIRFSRRGEQQRYVYLTPQSIQQYIVDWDNKKVPPPFKFRLRANHLVWRGPTSSAKSSKPRGTAYLQFSSPTGPNGAKTGKRRAIPGQPAPLSRRNSSYRYFGLRQLPQNAEA